MALVKGRGIRFDGDTLARLHAVADATGVGVGALVRIATTRFLEEIDKNGRLELPVQAVREQRAEYSSAKNKRTELQPIPLHPSAKAGRRENREAG